MFNLRSRRSANVRAAVACAPSSPFRVRGNPTTTRSAPCSRTIRTTAARPRFESGRSTTSSGVATVPEGSEIAHPQRAEPWSRARMRPISAGWSRERVLDLGPRSLQRLIELLWIPASRLGESVASATTSAYDLAGGSDHVTRLDPPLDGRRGHVGDDVNTAVHL